MKLANMLLMFLLLASSLHCLSKKQVVNNSGVKQKPLYTLLQEIDKETHYLQVLSSQLKQELNWNSTKRQKNTEESATEDATLIALQKISKAVSNSAEQASKKRTQILENVVKKVNDAAGSTKSEKSPLHAGSKKEVIIESDNGFNKIGSFKPPSLKIVDSILATKVNVIKTKGSPTVYNYPKGMGPLMMNGCFESGYKPSDPCARVRVPGEICNRILESALFIGVGFDGRGFYNAQSRKSSLIQRKCNKRKVFANSQLPDIMSAFGIYDITAETRSFSSKDEYVQYLTSKSRAGNQKGMFEQEKSRYSTAKSVSGDLGAMSALASGAAGGYAGGAAVAGAAAKLGQSAGASVGGSSGKGMGTSKSNTNQNSNGKTESESSNDEEQKSINTFFAILYINIVMYEITIDVITPDNLFEPFLKDYLNLPDSYFEVGATRKYQEFLIRYGTHYVKSAEFGGQLKIIKTFKSEKKITIQEFSKITEKEFKSLTNTLYGDVYQKEKGAKAFGVGYQSNKRRESQLSGVNQESISNGQSEQKRSQAFEESEFTETTVESQGGDPAVAKALFEFYSPTFKIILSNWIQSIPNYIRPFTFQLQALNDLLNVNMDLLFPLGEVDFGCLGKNAEFSKLLRKDNQTNNVYYSLPDDHFSKKNKKFTRRVFCRFKNIEDFINKLSIKLESLARAISIYMVEGPSVTDSFLLPAGKPGCETETLEYLGTKSNKSRFLSYFEMKSDTFKVQFEMPLDLGNLIKKDETVEIIFRGNKWFSLVPGSDMVNILSGCKVPQNRFLFNPVCIKGILFSYDEAGTLIMDDYDFKTNSQIIPGLNKIFLRYPAAKVHANSFLKSNRGMREAAIPCNIYWSNTHTLDISKDFTCVNFIAATEGDIFFIFSITPKLFSTWYYVQITSEGVGFYRAMRQEYARVGPGIGLLGDVNLYDSYFICLYHLPDNDLVLQYGKSPPTSDNGIVLASKRFATDGVRQNLRFYSFGSGEKEISFLQVEVVQRKKENIRCDYDWVLYNGSCFIDCDTQCKDFGQCDKPKDPSSCHDCKHFLTLNSSQKICTSDCFPGFEPSSLHQKQCNLCEVGTYKSQKGNSSCKFCDKGYYNSKLGAQKCTPCPIGFFSNSFGALSCKPCKKGYFSSIEASRSCQPCPKGYYTDIKNSWKCKPCELGEYSKKNGSSFCKKCKPGRVSNRLGAENCIRCPKGSMQPHPGRSICLPCDGGHFANYTGSKNCHACPAGTYQNKDGASKCFLCPPNSNSTRTGAVSCHNNCPPGSYSRRDEKKCVMCKPGTYQKGTGSFHCRKCIKGYFQPLNGQKKCLLAQPGTYVDKEGASHSIPCKIGTANRKSGETRSSSCIKCKEGTFSNKPGSNWCDNCPLGYFQDKIGQGNCNPCAKGFYSSNVGNKQCLPCKTGYVSSKTGSKSCTRCGKATIAVNGEKCKACGPGKYSYKTKVCLNCHEGTASNNPSLASKCPACKPGTYSDKKGATKCLKCLPGYESVTTTKPCKPCKAGFYQSTQGGIKCTRCRKGSFSRPGAAKCTVCEKGFYQPIGENRCVKCKPGYYSDSKGSKKCKGCPKGTFANKMGSSGCNKCNLGEYQSKTGKSYCDPCMEGSYSHQGASLCNDCKPGYYQDKKKQSNCVPCPPGYFSSNSKSVSCQKCPENYYQEKFGQSLCLACPKGSRSLAGKASCSGCPRGYEIGVVSLNDLVGEAGSNSFSFISPKCAFFGTNCKKHKQYWESDNSIITWPKVIFFKFFKPEIIFGFQIHDVKNKAPMKKTYFKFFGSNEKNCLEISKADILCDNEFGNKVSDCKNSKPFSCYGFIIEKNEGAKTAALHFPIKFYRKVTSKSKESCIPCPHGTYQPDNGGFACIFCSDGRYTDKTKSFSCTKFCKSGSRTNTVIGATRCSICPEGTYSSEGTSQCYACAKGTRALKKGSGKCTPCPKGWFMNLPGQKHCAACAVGCTSDVGAAKCKVKKRGDNEDLSICADKYLDVFPSEPTGSEQSDKMNSPTVKQTVINFYSVTELRRRFKNKFWDWKKYPLEEYYELVRDMKDSDILEKLPYWKNGKNWYHEYNYYKLPPNEYEEKPKE